MRKLGEVWLDIYSYVLYLSLLQYDAMVSIDNRRLCRHAYTHSQMIHTHPSNSMPRSLTHAYIHTQNSTYPSSSHVHTYTFFVRSHIHRPLTQANINTHPPQFMRLTSKRAHSQVWMLCLNALVMSFDHQANKICAQAHNKSSRGGPIIPAPNAMVPLHEWGSPWLRWMWVSWCGSL